MRRLVLLVLLLALGCSARLPPRPAEESVDPELMGLVARAVHDGDRVGLMGLVDQHPALLEPSLSGRVYAFYLSLEAERLEMVKVLLARGVDPNLADESGQRPLHWVAGSGGSSQALKVLLEAGADLNAVDLERRSALHLAAREDQFELARFLIDQGADLELKDSAGNTALHYAAEADEELVDYLVYRGAAVDTPNQRGETPLFLAVVAGRPACVAGLIGRGADTATVPSPLERAKLELERAREGSTEGLGPEILRLVERDIESRLTCLALMRNPAKVQVGADHSDDLFTVPPLEMWPWVESKSPQAPRS